MTDAPKQEKRTINRSTAYPGIALEKAIEATQQLRDNLGMTPFSRDSAATALGYKAVSGASVQKVSACVHFGLLSRKGNTYSQSELANQMFRYVSEEERTAAIKSAVQTPTLYSKLIREYSGRALPKMLDNILVRNYGITERVAKDVANIFEKSVQFAGLLQNGVLMADNAAYSQDQTGGDATVGEGEPVAFTDSNVVKNQPPQDSPLSVQAPVVPVGYLEVVIPDSDVKILFPTTYAYDLSMGSFKDGIEALSRDIKDTKPVLKNDEPTITT